MNIAVCDDEENFRAKLIKYIKEYDKSIQIVQFKRGRELLNSDKSFDIIFLDIEMPGMDGMKTAKKLRENKIESIIIFLTSYEEFVFDAYKVDAFRYIRKTNLSDLKEAMQAAETRISSRERIVINQKGKVYELNLSDIVYLEAFGDGTYIYDRFGRHYESFEQLKTWDEKLKDKGFFKIHKSYIVSLAYVESREDNSVTLKSTNNTLPVSRRNVTEFKEAYIEFIKKNAHII
ncbi:MAG: response regulator transcription factor [Lachnospiraceae bacterium]|nr:response regulator transcription factor [Lachnospiraceae bacterium]